MVNNRRFIRCTYSHYASINDDSDNWDAIKVGNLSAGGLNFYTVDERFLVGDELNLRLEIEAPNIVGMDLESSARGRIVRVTTCEDGLIEYGVEFIEKEISSLGAIIKYIME